MMLSTIIPNYNHAHLIGRAINALLIQSRPPDEVIIVDDCSTDDSRKVIQACAGRFSQIKVLLNDMNLGFVASLNRGVKAATGRYIYLAASDDWVEPGFFATAVTMLEKAPQTALFCGEVRVIAGETGRNLGMRPPVRPLWQAGCVSPEAVPRIVRGKGHWVVGCGTVYRREYVVAAGGLDPELGSFADGFLARKLALMYGFCFAPQIVATWNTYSVGLSRQAALQIDQATTLLRVAEKKMVSDISFPPSFTHAYSDLWRFSTARLAVQANPVNHAILAIMTNRTAVDRLTMQMIWSLLPDRSVRFATLAWLWFRLRPYSLIGLVRTAIARRFQ